MRSGYPSRKPYITDALKTYGLTVHRKRTPSRRLLQLSRSVDTSGNMPLYETQDHASTYTRRAMMLLAGCGGDTEPLPDIEATVEGEVKGAPTPVPTATALPTATFTPVPSVPTATLTPIQVSHTDTR